MQFRAGGHAPRQFGLDVHVHVFEFGPPAEFSQFDFAADNLEAVHDGITLGAREHADFLEHVGVNERADNIVPPEPPIKRDGLGELRNVRVRTVREASAARDWRNFFHAL
jgi:hypothetical protein